MEPAKKHINPIPDWAASAPVTWVLRNAARDGLLDVVASQIKLGCPVDSSDVVRCHVFVWCRPSGRASAGLLSPRRPRAACLQNGNTPLLLAAEAGHTEVVQALIDAGADTEARTKVCFLLFLHVFMRVCCAFSSPIGGTGWADTVPRKLHA